MRNDIKQLLVGALFNALTLVSCGTGVRSRIDEAQDGGVDGVATPPPMGIAAGASVSTACIAADEDMTSISTGSRQTAGTGRVGIAGISNMVRTVLITGIVGPVCGIVGPANARFDAGGSLYKTYSDGCVGTHVGNKTAISNCMGLVSSAFKECCTVLNGTHGPINLCKDYDCLDEAMGISTVSTAAASLATTVSTAAGSLATIVSTAAGSLITDSTIPSENTPEDTVTAVWLGCAGAAVFGGIAFWYKFVKPRNNEPMMEVFFPERKYK